jgi:hypothetical protein
MTTVLEPLTDPAAIRAARQPPGVLFRVLAAVTITTDDGQTTPLRCGACGQDSGPWLLSAYPGIALATCRCGHRGTHPRITQQEVEEYAEGFEAMFPSLDAAEAHLGFAGPGAATNDTAATHP